MSILTNESSSACHHATLWPRTGRCAFGLLLISAGCQLDVAPEAEALELGGRPAVQPAAAPEWSPLGSAGRGGSIAAADPPPAPEVQAAMSGRADMPMSAQAGSPATTRSNVPEMPSMAAGARAPVSQAAGAGSAPVSATMPPANTPATKSLAAAKSCMPGMYVGTFNGSIELVQLAALSSVTGTIRAELSPDGADALVLRNARLTGVDQDENDISATLTGRLNCSTHQLEDGKMVSGSYHMTVLGADAAFRGETTAMQSDDPPSAVGTWQATADSIFLLGGRGTWNLVLDEPARNEPRL